jgi:hypothetical protein
MKEAATFNVLHHYCYPKYGKHHYEQMKKKSTKASRTVTLVGKPKATFELFLSFVLLHLHVISHCKLVSTKYDLPKGINFRQAVLL